MNEEFGFSLHRRGTHRLAGRTILQMISSLDAGDGGRAAIEVAGTLADAGGRPLVAAPHGPLVSELQARGGVWIDFPSQAKNPIAMALNARRLKALIARERVDLVHARSRPAGWVAYAATRATKTALVTSLLQVSPGQSIIKQRYNSVMAKGDTVIAGSRFAAATIASLYPVAFSRITLIRPGVDLRPFAADAIEPARVQSLRTAWQVAPDERIVMLAGPPGNGKGHKAAIEAIRLLDARGIRDLKLVFVTDGPSRGGPSRGSQGRGGQGSGTKGLGKELDQAVKAAGLVGRVRKIAACADMPAALLAAAIVVVPSIDPETYGRVAIEAQAVGVPVIVSDLGAVPETVLAPPDIEAARRTGWRVSPSDANLLAEAMAEALSLGASGRDALAARARKQAVQRFAIDRMTHETLDAYAGLLERQALMA